MQQLLGKHWHHLPIAEVTDILESNTDKGLDLFEIKHRQERFGLNIVTGEKGKSPLERFLLQFNNPLIYILLASSIITFVLKDAVDALIIFGVVLVNAIIGYVQEAKAEKAIEALAQTLVTEATVLRAGKTERISAVELVPGDVVVLKAGDKVPADMRLVRTRDLQVAEAALTGESAPVQKWAADTLPHDLPLAERTNMAYGSTLVTYGTATGIVTATGNNTEVGRISQLIATAQDLETPLTRKIAQFSRLVLYAVLVLTAISFTIGVLRGQAIVETFTAAVALAVAMIPEGLPAALTVTLAIGVSRMAQRRAIIRKLPAVETLGSVTVICSDKTGTLTQNQMTVQQIVVPGAWYNVTGSGYAPDGQIVFDGQPATAPTGSALAECLSAGILCNDSAVIEEDGRWQAQGDPTEVALLVAGRKAGLSLDDIHKKMPRLDAIPFESQHQYMATLHQAGPERIVYLKGAAEVVLARCTTALDAAGQPVALDEQWVHSAVNTMAGQGLRVLAFARLTLPAQTTNVGHDDVARGLTFLGLQGIIDPPRAEATAAVRACQEAGIRVKMITGDHALTAATIAAQIGIDGAAGQPKVLTGRQMAELSDEQLIEAAATTSVFARVSPEQKLRLVEALQARNNVVAMTGDGVNDGPALKQSDIGIAMGISGTDVAKEAADMVLTDDNFATIEAAVEEGRSVFDNLTKIIVWTLPTNIGEGMIILAALVLGVVLPILPLQVLWINMTTGALLGIVLALELREAGIMKRPPRNPQAPILTRELVWRVLIVSTLILIGAFGLFEYKIATGVDLARARTVAVNVVIVIEIFYLFNCRSLTLSVFRIGVLSSRWAVVGVSGMVVLMLLFTYAPFMNTIFHSAPLTLVDWAQIVALGVLPFIVIEVEKWLRCRDSSHASVHRSG